jgi:hypothetical protein
VVLLVSMSAGLASQPSPQARGSGLTTQPPRSASPPGRAE